MKKSLENLEIKLVELSLEIYEDWKNNKEKFDGDYKKYELVSDLVNQKKILEAEIVELKKNVEEEVEVEELKNKENKLWITTPNYNSLNWGRKKLN